MLETDTPTIFMILVPQFLSSIVAEEDGRFLHIHGLAGRFFTLNQ